MKSGRKIRLIAKTHKGKNRVKEGGEIWIVIAEGIIIQNVVVNIPGDNNLMRIIPESMDESKIRWILKENDPDFEWSDYV